MKSLLLSFICCLSFAVYSQNFEGTIKWSITTDITDPVTKKKIEDAKKQLSDPKTQEQLKEMEEKMKDPQFKQMMEQNPQMKKQLELAMAAMQPGGGGMDAMIPKSFTMEMKNGNSLTKIEGGMMAGEILNLKDKDQSYTLNRQAKTYSILPKGKIDAQKPPAKVTMTGEKKKILNYNCTKYIVEITEKGKKVTQNIWTTKEIKDIDSDYFTKSKFGHESASLYYQGMEGIPMRVEMNTPEMSMIMEMIDIKKGSLAASDFAIPSDFKETKYGY